MEAAITERIPITGQVLTNPGLETVPDGDYALTFKIFTAETSGTKLWEETQTIGVKRGIFTAQLGAGSAFGTQIDWNSADLWLEVTFNGDSMTPRKRVLPTATAINTEKLQGVAFGLASNGDLTMASGLIPSTNGTYNLGSSTNHFATLFADTISASSSSISGTNSTAFTIDTGQTTNNTDSSSVRFYLGPTLNDYSALQWTGSSNRFDLYSRISSSTLADLRAAAGTFTGTLGVTGATTLSSTLGVTGATTLSSTLGVTGATTLSSTLGVTGATTLSSTLGVTGATTLSSTLGVTGATTLSSTLGVTGATTLSSTLGVTGATTLSSTLGVTGATTLSSTLGVTGATTLSSTLGVTGASTLSSTLGVTGATTLSSTLGVTGATTLSSTLGVTGATTLSSTLGVTGAATLSSTLDVTGTTTLGVLTVNGNSTTGDTDITLGDASTDRVVVNAALHSNLIPSTDNTFDLGSSSKTFANFYATNAVFQTTSTPNTSATDFVIGNTTTTTGDTRDETLKFDLGTATSPRYAIVGWDSTLKRVYTNKDYQIQGNTYFGDASSDTV
ncbi:hypothetical protein HY065_02850, partial [Candidatus Berkelbacteria bacterium]|nr:hypothetical protein [Candidatus Berkelbacteria bacterium]